MKLTISKAAKKMNLTTHTIRYYDKEGLLPFVERTESGILRVYEGRDFSSHSIRVSLL